VPYTVAITLFDFGPIFPVLPTYTGRFFNIPPGPPFDTATAAGPGGPLVFPIMPATPMVPMALHVTDGAGGDLFRSGLVVVPPSPASLSLVTAVGAVSAAALPPMTARLAGTSFPLDVPDGLRVLIGTFGFGFVPPHSLTILVATVVPGAGTLALTITGSATYRWLFLIPVTSTFTYTTTLTLTPSADAKNPGQIVRATPGGSTLSFSDPFLARLSAFVGVVDGMIAPRIEGVFNTAVVGAVDAFLAGRGSVRTSTSVISARRIVVAAGGISLQIGLADFVMPVVATPVSTALKIAITPQPVEGTSQTYTVRVTSAGAPVAGAAVTLTNYKTGTVNTTTSNLPATNAQGETTFTAALRGFHRDTTDHAGGVVNRYPKLTATKAGFQSATLELVMASLL
jgi:hypothetical protein